MNIDLVSDKIFIDLDYLQPNTILPGRIFCCCIEYWEPPMLKKKYCLSKSKRLEK